jgi:hypothetical protein
VGSTQRCHVNPRDPAAAALRPGLTPGFLFAFIPLALLLGGWIGWRRLARPAVTAAAPPVGELTAPTTRAPKVLTPKASPGLRLLGTLLLCGFWNGIVGVFVVMAVKSFQQGRPEWFLCVFLIPFVLIGLVLLWAVLYGFLALFNPTPLLRLEPAAPLPGQPTRLQWKMKGWASRLRSLTITLEGREEVSYSAGSSTSTDKAVFHQQTLLASRDPREIARGMVELALPPEALPSFSASHNKIIWQLTVTGEIRRWPDLKEEFVLEVPPWG